MSPESASFQMLGLIFLIKPIWVTIMSALKRNMKLESLEIGLNWYGAFRFCQEEWLNDKNDIDKSLRFLTETWYIISYWEQIPHYENGVKVHWPHCEDVDYNLLIPALLECLDECDKAFSGSPLYLCISGYLMKVHPEWFVQYPDRQWDTIYEEGMCRMTAQIIKNDSVASMLQKAFLHQNVLLEDEILSLFPGNSEIDQFFRTALTNT